MSAIALTLVIAGAVLVVAVLAALVLVRRRHRRQDVVTGGPPDARELFSRPLAGTVPITTADLWAEVDALTSPPTGTGATTPTGPAAEAGTGPATEPVTEPATEPATEAATEPATEPVTEAATEPATEPATEAATEPATEPVAEPAGGPEARSLVGWRGSAPFAALLGERLDDSAHPGPGELVAAFDGPAPTAVAEEVVAALEEAGYAVRWRRADEVAASRGGRVARVVVADPAPGEPGGIAVGVELEPDEVVGVAVKLVRRLQAQGYRIERRSPTGVALRTDQGARACVARVRRP